MLENEKKSAAESSGKEDFASLYEQSFTALEEGQIVKGKIVAITEKDVFVDIGYKSEGILSINEFRNLGEINVGDEVSVFLESKENDEGMVVLSKEKADRTEGWENVSTRFNEGDNIEGTVVKKVKGGFMVNIGIEAFLPASLLRCPKNSRASTA
jgi:small subunit ribosomal protein S1